MSGGQAKELMLRKVRVRPALMVAASSTAPLAGPLPQNAAQAHPDPRIKSWEGCPMTVLEIAKPAPERAI